MVLTTTVPTKRRRKTMINDELMNLIEPTEDDHAKLAVNRVLKEESADITTKFMALVKNKLKLLDTVFQNIEILQIRLFSSATFTDMDTSQMIKLLQVLASMQHTLEIPLEDQKVTINHINAQINNVLNSDKTIVNLPRESRIKLKNTLMSLLKGTIVDEP